MAKQRGAAALMLLCALLLSAFAAQSASAKGTTAFECAIKSVQGSAGFEDSHCDDATNTGALFEHKEIPPGTAVEVTYTNERTASSTTAAVPWENSFFVGLTPAQVICTGVTGIGKITNKVVAEVMQNTGTGINLKFTGCTAVKPAKCTVKEPIEIKNATSTTVEKLGTGKNEMGLELKPEAGKPLTTIVFQGAECGIKGVETQFEGPIVGTSPLGSTEAVTNSGATEDFTKAMTKETLKASGKPAEIEGVITLRRDANAVVDTTTAS